ncbi:MAG: hypothetical protein IJX63_06430 [Lachnospiraceae bacterium]|nr:hypothetical protein [Lachnospiraceae bacterium]
MTMIKWIIGINASGKTVLLIEGYTACKKAGNKVISNIRENENIPISQERLQLILSDDVIENVFSYEEPMIVGDSIYLKAAFGRPYSKEFLNILSIVCLDGDYIFLDEPERGLTIREQNIIGAVLKLVLPTYKGGIITTHSEEFFDVQPDNFYLCNNYQLSKIEGDRLHEFIAKF